MEPAARAYSARERESAQPLQIAETAQQDLYNNNHKMTATCKDPLVLAAAASCCTVISIVIFSPVDLLTTTRLPWLRRTLFYSAPFACSPTKTTIRNCNCCSLLPIFAGLRASQQQKAGRGRHSLRRGSLKSTTSAPYSVEMWCVVVVVDV